MDVHVSLVGRKDLSGEIYRQLRQAIVDGRLRPGERLPASRELARRLSVSRMTVTVAYDRLSAGGFISTRVGAGTFVELRVPTDTRRATERGEGALRPRSLWSEIPLPRPFVRPARFDFRSGVPDASLFPFEAWRRLTARFLRPQVEGVGVYDDAAGHRDLRDAIARHIGVARDITATAADVTVTSGTQQAIDLLARVLLAPGDRVAVEDPGYPPPARLFQSLGMRVTGVPVDREGLVVEALPTDARLVYVTPSHQYPLGMSLSLSRRLALLEWADRHGAAILEDDYDSEFRFGGRPIEPLSTLDARGRVAYVGSFSKTLLPTLRMGFVVIPPSLRDAVHRARFVTDWHSPLVIQQALAAFIASGDFARHVRRMNRVYAARHALVVDTLARDFGDRLEVLPSDAGIHVCALAPALTVRAVDAIVECAAEAGVAVQPLHRLGVSAPGPTGLLLGYGAIVTGDIAEGLRRLRRCLPA